MARETRNSRSVSVEKNTDAAEGKRKPRVPISSEAAAWMVNSVSSRRLGDR